MSPVPALVGRATPGLACRRGAVTAGLAAAAIAWALFTLPGCGRREAERLTVELVAAAVDGEAPTVGWRLRDPAGGEFPLVATGRKGERKGPLLVASRPAGAYALVGPPGWALVGGPTFGPLSPGAAAPLGVGKDRSVYVVPPPGHLVKDVIVTFAGREREATPVPSRVERGDDGRVVLRVEPDAWRDAYLVRATLAAADGAQAASSARGSAFARVTRVVPPPSGACTGVALLGGGVVAARIEVASVAPGRTLRIVAEDEGLSVERDVRLDARGAADVPDLPATTGWMDLSWADTGAAPTRWRVPGRLALHGDLRLLGGEASPPLAVAVSGGDLPDEDFVVAARGPGHAAYGVAPNVLRAEDGRGFTVALAPGAWRFLVTTPDAVGLGTSEGDARPVVTLQRPSRVQLTVEGGVPKGRRYDLECVREEEDGERSVEVTAQGWWQRAVAASDLELALPTGRYRLRLREGGRLAPWTALSLERPATRVALRLPPPR